MTWRACRSTVSALTGGDFHRASRNYQLGILDGWKRALLESVCLPQAGCEDCVLEQVERQQNSNFC